MTNPCSFQACNCHSANEGSSGWDMFSGGWCGPRCMNFIVRHFLLYVWGQQCELAKASFVWSCHYAVLFGLFLSSSFQLNVSLTLFLWIFFISPFFYFLAKTGPGKGQTLTDFYSPSWLSSSYMACLTRCKWAISAGSARVMALALEVLTAGWANQGVHLSPRAAVW